MNKDKLFKKFIVEEYDYYHHSRREDTKSYYFREIYSPLEIKYADDGDYVCIRYDTENTNISYYPEYFVSIDDLYKGFMEDAEDIGVNIDDADWLIDPLKDLLNNIEKRFNHFVLQKELKTNNNNKKKVKI